MITRGYRKSKKEIIEQRKRNFEYWNKCCVELGLPKENYQKARDELF